MSISTLKNYNIMYVEDEKEIRNNISNVLKYIFKDVLVFEDAISALEFFNENQDKAHIILSDISMPKMSGIEFSKKIREINKEIPLILLTAHTDKDILLEATRLKLIDYLVKPLNLDELKNALLKAKEEIKIDNSIVPFMNGVSFNTKTQELFNKNEVIHLTHLELKLLELLIEHKNRILSEDEIKDLIWDDTFIVSDSAFKSLINKLRKKIGKESIKNFSKLGYQIQFS